jgi:hypothetical protein
MTLRRGQASTVAWVPGLSENDNEDGDDGWSTFPNGGWVDVPIDETFVGDQRQSAPVLLDTFLSNRKSVQGLFGDYKQYRFHNGVRIEFTSTTDSLVDTDQPVTIKTNGQLPDEYRFQSNLVRSGPADSLELIDPFDPEDLPSTIVEEPPTPVENAISDIWDDEFGAGVRVRTASARRRYLTAEVDTFLFDGKAIEGVRVSSLWGSSNPFTELPSVLDNIPYVPRNVDIYSWIDMVVLADGTQAVRVQDCTQFPKHNLYTGYSTADDYDYLVTEKADNGLDVIFDVGETTNGGFQAAISDKDHQPWTKFENAFIDDTKFVPYSTTTSQKEYLKNHDRDTTGRLIGYKNESLTDHPVMTYGQTDDGATTLSRSEVEDILSPRLSPFPATIDYFK